MRTPRRPRNLVPVLYPLCHIGPSMSSAKTAPVAEDLDTAPAERWRDRGQ